MPAAAVTPAKIAYIKVVAVKKLVVEFRAWLWTWSLPYGGVLSFLPGLYLLGNHDAFKRVFWGSRTFTLKKLECLKQAFA